MSNLLSTEFLSAFLEIDKIKDYLEAEKDTINSNPLRKSVQRFLMYAQFIIFPMVIFFSRGKKGNGVSIADRIEFTYNYELICFILFFLIAVVFVLRWWYTGFIFKKEKDRVTLEPIFKQLCGKKHHSNESSNDVISYSREYLIYLAEFLQKHKPAAKDDYKNLQNKLSANFMTIRLCITLLIYLKRDLKTSLIPNFDNKIFKRDRYALKEGIDNLMPILSEELQNQCKILMALKDNNPDLLQIQAEEFLSRPLGESQVPKVLQFLDYLAAS